MYTHTHAHERESLYIYIFKPPPTGVRRQDKLLGNRISFLHYFRFRFRSNGGKLHDDECKMDGERKWNSRISGRVSAVRHVFAQPEKLVFKLNRCFPSSILNAAEVLISLINASQLSSIEKSFVRLGEATRLSQRQSIPARQRREIFLWRYFTVGEKCWAILEETGRSVEY